MEELKATRKDLQWARRFFHCCMGVLVGTVYRYLLTHTQSITILGLCASIVYVLEQFRINYPALAQKIAPMIKNIYRAEEQLKESAGIPFIMGILLTIITFPKLPAVIAIYTLGISDPLSAIIGIRFGKHHIVEHKSIEGSTAFFLSHFFIVLFVYYSANLLDFKVAIFAFISATIISGFEMLPIKIDDNLTIPLITAIVTWTLCALFSIPVS